MRRFGSVIVAVVAVVLLGAIVLGWGVGSANQKRAEGAHPRSGEVRRHVEMLAGTIGERNVWKYDALQRSADYVAAELRAAGYAPTLQPYSAGGKTVHNIEATLGGGSSAAEIVVVGAHYDSVHGTPGADDNATGVSALIELARRFANRAHARTIRFVAFVNEEPPFFKEEAMGSLVYARAAAARGDRITAMLSLETIGYYSDREGSQEYPSSIAWLYPKTGNFIGFVSNVGSARLLLKARREFKRATTFPVQSASVPASIPGVSWSDHWSFWEAGYEAMMITDTAPFRNPWYHTAEDTPDKIDYDRLAHLVDGLEPVIAALAGGAGR